MKHPRTYVKAIAGGLATAAATIGTSMLDGHLTGPEVVAGLGLGLSAGAAVYLTPANASS